MTDELKPELKDALEKLPRERMPAGLQAKVGDAMREHGFLAKRRRMVVMTNSRVAGLLAASIALMIGAYSIGLHRGGGEQVLPVSTPALRQDVDRAVGEKPETPLAEAKGDVPVADEFADAPAAKVEPEPKAAMKKELAATEEEAADRVGREQPVDRDDARQRVGRSEGFASERDEVAEAPARGSRTLKSQDAVPPRAMAESVAPEPPSEPLVFMLGGLPFIVDAPDSVRVEQDERGTMLIIYTSDGIIRIRPARNN